ncbi:hypothetical protein MKZ38_007318 [Zalerion maritima]|uniref:Chromatin structure-remodeling complex subunit rsc9 n=1 Tax=Zalerion maritima TaxID=339359 RepID=A0AAD5RIK7_9PEZI|nr:hypothetical protein MKZ38_007318 [Zalerion maritima]
MAPKNADAEPHFIDRTPEYEDFMQKLTEFHQKRGTNLDPEPKIGSCHIDLLKLFNHVVKNGGYDKISAEKLAWRRMTEEINIPAGNIAQTSFQVKSCFYRFLAAYEIKSVHNQEPPPKELLEDQSAKGGSLLTRTWENNPFKNAGGNPDAATDHSGDDSTPARERPANPNASSARASRGLREAPPQRVLFQPDTGPTRTARHASGHHPGGHHTGHSNSAGNNSVRDSQSASSHLANISTPTSHPAQAHSALAHHPSTQQQHLSRGVSASYQPQITDNISSAVNGYEPRQNIIVPILPVNTPINNPSEFMKKKRQRLLVSSPYDQSQSPAVRLPCIGYEGPNIYLRCLFALRSSLPAEQAFALTHLVRISFERGDKYKFDSFPGLSDGLIDKALEVGSIFYHVNWSISFNSVESEQNISVLDGLNGTDDILDRISCLAPKPVSDDVVPADQQDLLTNVTEAVLTIRNMVILPENAAYMADSISLRDLLCILLNLPPLDMLVEVKHYALEIAEVITPYLVLEPHNPMYISIVSQLKSSDRGMILLALRALARTSMNLEATNRLGDISTETLKDVTTWMLLNDEDLVDACLDFFYQYTAVVPNVEHLVQAVNLEILVSHLVRLLAHGAVKKPIQVVLKQSQARPPPNQVAVIPKDLVKRLLATDEPIRCQQWLRGFFEEDSNSVITQMTVWQAYQNAFSEPVKQNGRQMINPSEFIKYVSHVFPGAQAQIIKEPAGNKFVIRGIRARPRPLGPDGRMYYPCEWRTPERRLCGESYSNPEDMYKHILASHLPTKEGSNGTEPDTSRHAICSWFRCQKFNKPTSDVRAVALHTKVHAAYRPVPFDSKVSSKSYIEPAKVMNLQGENTPTTTDERNQPQAVGVPLSAALVLCNIARNVVKTKAEDGLLKKQEMGGEGGGWNERLFRPILPRLREVMTENASLTPYMTRLLITANLLEE